MKKIILDSSAFLHGILNSFSEYKTCVFLTTPLIAKEIKSSISKEKFNFLMKSGNLKIIEAEKEDVEKVEEAVKKEGFHNILSDADISVLALAYKLKEDGEEYFIATNDFAMQNIAKILDLNFRAFSGEEIKSVISFSFICSGCRKEYKQYRKICDVCGSKIKRKVIKA